MRAESIGTEGDSWRRFGAELRNWERTKQLAGRFAQNISIQLPPTRLANYNRTKNNNKEQNTYGIPTTGRTRAGRPTETAKLLVKIVPSIPPGEQEKYIYFFHGRWGVDPYLYVPSDLEAMRRLILYWWEVMEDSEKDWKKRDKGKREDEKKRSGRKIEILGEAGTGQSARRIHGS